MFLRWIWYASRRAGLHLDEAEDDFATQERVEKALRIIAPTLRLSQSDQEQLLPHARITRYGADEPLQFAGQVPKRMTFIVNGQVRLIATGDDGALIPVRTLDEGDFLGQTSPHPRAGRGIRVRPWRGHRSADRSRAHRGTRRA